MKWTVGFALLTCWLVRMPTAGATEFYSGALCNGGANYTANGANIVSGQAAVCGGRIGTFHTAVTEIQVEYYDSSSTGYINCAPTMWTPYTSSYYSANPKQSDTAGIGSGGLYWANPFNGGATMDTANLSISCNAFNGNMYVYDYWYTTNP